MGAACHSKSKKSSQPQSQPQIRDEPQPQPPVPPPKEEITQLETQKKEENQERRDESDIREENLGKKEENNWKIREEDKIAQEIEPDILPKEKTSNLKNEQFPGVLAFPHYEGYNEGEKEEMRTSLHSTQKTRREIFGETSKGLIGNTRNVGDFDEPMEGEEAF